MPENYGSVMAFRIQSLLCVHILILNAYLPIMTYMSLFTTEQTLRWTVVYYHSHTFCQLKTDNFLLLEYLAHGYNTQWNMLSLILALAAEQSSTLSTGGEFVL